MIDLKRTGAEIRRNRHWHDLTQKEVGAKLGVTEDAVCRWERGHCLPRTETLLKLADLLDIYVEDLVKFEEEKND